MPENQGRSPRPAGWPRRTLAVGCLVAVYVVVARLSLEMGSVGGVAAPVWLPAGLALAAIVTFGFGFWPGVAIGTFLAKLSVGVPVLGALGMGCGNAAEAVLGAALLRLVGFRPALDRVRDVLALIVLAAGLGALVSAFAGTGSAWLTGVLATSDYWTVWRYWWVGDAMGTMVVAPALLVWSDVAREDWRPARVAEAGLLLVGLAAVGNVVFGATTAHGEEYLGAYAVFPFVMWAVLRFRQPTVAVTVAVGSGMAIWFTARGSGPFAIGAPLESLLLLQTFNAVVVSTALVLGAAMSERRGAEAALRAGEARYRDLFANAPCGYHSTDATGTVVEMNDTELSWLGYRHGEIVGRVAFADLMSPSSRGLFAENFRLLKARGRVRDGEYELVHRDGSTLPVLLSATAVYDKDGRFLRSRATVYDLTERRRAEAATRALAAIVQFSDDAIFSARLNGVIASWNAGAERMFGYAAADVIGKPIDALIPGERAGETLSIIELLGHGETVQDRETQWRRKDGARIDVSLTVSPIHGRAGVLTAVSIIARNITERKALERLRADFVATLTHDIRNPVGNLAAFVEMLRGSGLNAGALDLVERMEQSVETIFELVTNYLDRARLESGGIELRKSPQALNDTLTKLMRQYEAVAARRSIGFVLELEPGLPPVDADPLALDRVFGNLLHNALKFTPPGGRIIIRTRAEFGAVAASVADTGPGIAPQEIPNLFSNDHRARPLGSRRGTGLGLFIVRSLVESHGGTVHMESGAGGSCLTVRLPAANPGGIMAITA